MMMKLNKVIIVFLFSVLSCERIDNPDPPFLLPLTDRCIEGYFNARFPEKTYPLCQQLLEYSITPTIFQQVKYNTDYQDSLAIRAAAHLEDIFQQQYCQIFMPVVDSAPVTTDFHVACAFSGDFLTAQEDSGTLTIFSFANGRISGAYTGSLTTIDNANTYDSIALEFDVPFVDIAELAGYEL